MIPSAVPRPAAPGRPRPRPRPPPLPMLLLLLLIAGLQMAAARPSDQSTSALPEGQPERKEESAAAAAAAGVAPSAPTVPASSPAATEDGGDDAAAAEVKDTNDTQQAHKTARHSGTLGASLLGRDFSSDHGNVHGWSHGTPHSSGAAAGAAAAARAEATGGEGAPSWDGTAHASIHGAVHGNEDSGGGGGTGAAVNQPLGQKISLNVLPVLSPNPYFHEVPVLLKGPKYSFLSYQSKVSVDLGDDVWGVPEFPVGSDFGSQVGEEDPAKRNMGNAFGSKRPYWAQDEEEGWSAGHSTAIAAQDEEGFGYGWDQADCANNGVSADDEAAFLEALLQAQAQEAAAAAFGTDYDEVVQAVANANTFGDYPDYGATFVNDYDAIYNSLAGIDALGMIAGADDFGTISEALALIGEEDAALASALSAYGDDGGVGLVAEYLAGLANANAAAYGAQGDPHLTHAYGPGAAVAAAGNALSHVTYGSHGSLPWHRPGHGGAAANSNSNHNKATYGGGGVVNADALQKVTYGGGAAAAASSSSASSASSEDGDGARPTASASSVSDADPAAVTLAKTVSEALSEQPTAKTKSVKATTRVRLAPKTKGKARRSTAAAFLRA